MTAAGRARVKPCAPSATRRACSGLSEITTPAWPEPPTLAVSVESAWSSSRLLRTANMAASMRDFIWSFSSMLRMWFLTVFSLMNSSSAISRLLWPCATWRSTCSSRAVS